MGTDIETLYWFFGYIFIGLTIGSVIVFKEKPRGGTVGHQACDAMAMVTLQLFMTFLWLPAFVCFGIYAGYVKIVGEKY